MKSLYAYYGLLDLHEIDSPGHSFYQVGLLDSIKCTFNEQSFDFYSYYPEEVLSSELINRCKFPNTELGQVFERYSTELVGDLDQYCMPLEQVIKKIENREYDRLYLKARFRNLSALAKKWKDARVFNELIEVAVSSGYERENIIILDTDLSLPDSFYRNYSSVVTVKIPSIDFPSISKRFLLECVEVHRRSFNKRKTAVFYGNLDTSNYKEGNQKSEILDLVLRWFEKRSDLSEDSALTIIHKAGKAKPDFQSVKFIDRNLRFKIWNELECSLIMINVTKEKYDDLQFIPARVFEAMIFGMIPVSYKFNFISPAFSFNSLLDLEEIISYLDECGPSDHFAAYEYFIKDYLKKANYQEDVYVQASL